MDREPTSAKEFAGANARIGPDRSGQRMQEALVGLFPDWLPSRKSCRKAIDRGEIHCNGNVAGTALRVETGDQVHYRPKAKDAPDPGAIHPGPLRLHRPNGADFAFIWKPAGIATSGPGARHLAGLIAHRAQHGSPEEQAALKAHQPDGMPAPHPAHRLDRATAGWICVALTLPVAEALGRAFADRQVDKRYLALAAGRLQDGHVETPLDGKPSHTAWRALGTGPLPVHGEATLLDIRPTTGRTHQIRRHLAEVGHPLVGEDEHAAPGVDPATAPRYSGQGLFLCAISMALPEGDHGPAAAVHATPPSKYRRIRWVADALEQHGCN